MIRLRTRTRTREQVTTTTVAKKAEGVPADLRELVRQIEESRLAANEANRIAAAAKKKLFTELDKRKIKPSSFRAKVNGKMAVLSLVKEEGYASSVDTKEFKKRVSPQVFMQCIVVQKGLADKFAGKAVREECEVGEATEASWGIKTEFVSE